MRATATLKSAIATGNLEMVQQLHKLNRTIFPVSSMDYAAENGQLEVVKWLHNNTTEGCTTWAMDCAAKNGHLEVVKWLHENRTEGCTTAAMDCAAENGNIEVVMWLHENRKEGCTANAMDWAAANGYLKVVKWLRKNRTEGCTFYAVMFNSSDEIVWFLALKYKDLKTTRTTNHIVNKLYSSIETVEKAWSRLKLKKALKRAALRYRLKRDLGMVPIVGAQYMEAAARFEEMKSEL